jgi:hypothetical protein
VQEALDRYFANLKILLGEALDDKSLTPAATFQNYFFAPRTASFAALATRNLTTVLAGILIFSCVLGLKPIRAFLFCFTNFPKPGRTNSPFFLISL